MKTTFNAVSSVERVRTSRLARNALLDADGPRQLTCHAGTDWVAR